MNEIIVCPYQDCTRKSTCRTNDFANCPVYMFGYLPNKEIIDEENRIFIEVGKRYLERLIKNNGTIRGISL